MPARAAASTWLRISASSGDTITVGPAPAAAQQRGGHEVHRRLAPAGALHDQRPPRGRRPAPRSPATGRAGSRRARSPARPASTASARVAQLRVATGAGPVTSVAGLPSWRGVDSVLGYRVTAPQVDAETPERLSSGTRRGPQLSGQPDASPTSARCRTAQRHGFGRVHVAAAFPAPHGSVRYRESAEARVADRLAGVGYLASTAVATTVFLADRLGKPLLVEGPAGVGKTELAKAVAEAAGADLVRLQCYEGIDEARALYEWNHAKQLLRITAGQGDESWDEARDDIFCEEFLLPRPLLTAIRSDEPDRAADRRDRQGRRRGRGPAAGGARRLPGHRARAGHDHRRPAAPSSCSPPTPPASCPRRCSRRCLFLHIDFPDAELERRIVRAQGARSWTRRWPTSLVRVVGALRAMELRKAPSVSETIDWARTLLALGADTLDDDAVQATLGRRPQAPGRHRAGLAARADLGA